MADSIHEQIVQALVDRVEGIVGDGGATFWFTPDAVYAASWISEIALKPAKTVTYLFVPDVEEEEDETFTRTSAVMRLDLAACRRFERATEDPADSQETRWQIQNKLAQDAKKRLRGDYKLGGLSLHVKIPVTDRSAEETWHPKWAIVFLRLEVMYEYADTTP